MPKRANIARRPLSPSDIMEADRLGYTNLGHAHSRVADTTIAIDDIPYYQESDRDDGIRVEKLKDGGYRAHITISDVASYVPHTNPLAEVAWQRGFTEYRPERTDHMFEENLVYRMSLEHHKKRLGMRVSIDLDENFQPTHTELTPTYVTPTASSYAHAAHKMKSDPQYKLMAKVAKGLQKEYFGQNAQGLSSSAFGERVVAMMSADDIQLQHLAPARRPISGNTTRGEIEVTKLVEIYMLLANSAVANLFADTNLPFAFRNFSDERPARDGVPQRAYYHTDWHAHTKLEEMGLNRPYCHFTSPIRRGPDYFNGRMAHYAIALIDHITAKTIGWLKIDSSHEAAFKHYLWEHAHEILEHAGAQEGKWVEEMNTLLEQGLKECGIEEEAIDKGTLSKAIIRSMDLPIPYEKDDLLAKLEHINTLSDLERTRLAAPEEKIAAKYEAKRNALSALTDESCKRLADDAFSARLQDAALIGYLPDALMNEALKRIESISALPKDTVLTTDASAKNGKRLGMNQVEDALSILVRAQYPYDPKWLELKKAMCRAIHDKPGIFRIVYQHAFEGYESLGNKVEPVSGHYAKLLSSHLPVDNLADDRSSISTAIGSIDMDGRTLSAPTYSIGHDKRSAESHAYYFFLESYAFGQLQPFAQTMVPNLLYAELDNSEKPKRALAEDMLSEIRATLSTTEFHQAEDGQWFARLRASGGRLADILPIAAKAETQQAAEDRALARLLRNPTFRSAVAHKAPPELHAQLNPRKLLQQKAEEHGHLFEPERDIHVTPASLGFSNGFKATITIMDDQASIKAYTPWEIEPNKDRAINRACMQVLMEHEWIKEEELEQAPPSWLSRTSSAPKIDLLAK